MTWQGFAQIHREAIEDIERQKGEQQMELAAKLAPQKAKAEPSREAAH